jgi:hypothetical protein
MDQTNSKGIDKTLGAYILALFGNSISFLTSKDWGWLERLALETMRFDKKY